MARTIILSDDNECYSTNASLFYSDICRTPLPLNADFDGDERRVKTFNQVAKGWDNIQPMETPDTPPLDKKIRTINRQLEQKKITAKKHQQLLLEAHMFG